MSTRDAAHAAETWEARARRLMAVLRVEGGDFRRASLLEELDRALEMHALFTSLALTVEGEREPVA